METNGIVFLDIDGVVNTIMAYPNQVEGLNLKEKEGYYFDLCWPGDKRVSNKQAMTLVSKLCTDYKLDIVITSTWSIGHSLDEIRESLYSSGLKREVNIIGTTCTNMFKSRGFQIEAWLTNNKLDYRTFPVIILDDDSDMLGFKTDFTKYLLQTNTYIGFSFADYIKAQEIIDKQLEVLG